ncbi:neprilysin-3-like isoform X2 [Anthonomus grandis grandis]|uniref:neprilysin-3-like isoform X2 n=1 Tax=Anthonomus grandis grandis TaxID=2921223 RepID=UPI0021651B0D|nr:neprilysin-3-like isoform X2 [Anthonomus grandis grandis]
MTAKMTRYTNADFGDDDSVNSVQLTEGISASATHIRYHPRAKVWEALSNLERALIIMCGLLFMVVVVLIVAVEVMGHHLDNFKEFKKRLEADQPCLNKSCVHIASNVLSSMDFSVDPCEDFYSYACNGWVSANPVPEGKSNWGTFMKLEQQNYLVIKHVLGKDLIIRGLTIK